MPQPKLLTPEEYLAVERRAAFRSEYMEGETFAMAGASKRHNLIVSNLIRLLGNQLLTRDCNVYPSDMRVKVESLGKYTYPDVSVICGEERFEDENDDVLLNPTVIFEVLSESTEAYDRGKKFEHYQRVESLLEYVLVSQDARRIERFVRREGRFWAYVEHRDASETVALETIGCEIALQDVYVKVF